jgi:nucleoside-diphosphate-sugar epimerase
MGTGRRTFVTGASGSVGATVCAELLRRGDDVVALVRKVLPLANGCRMFFGDLSRIRDAAAEVMQADSIVHCASPRTDDRMSALREDIIGTANLLDLWQQGSFVFASSQTVYGIPTGVLRETNSVRASGWYDLAKICNEQQAAMIGGTGRRGAGISLRLPLVFAAGHRRRDRQFLPQLYDALIAENTFIFGSELGLETFGSVFIGEDDLGRAFADARSITESGPYNLASGFCTWRELLEELGRQCGYRPRYAVRENTVPAPGEFRVPQSRSFYDCTRFQAASGFRPSQTLMDVIDKFVRAERSASMPCQPDDPCSVSPHTK